MKPIHTPRNPRTVLSLLGVLLFIGFVGLVALQRSASADHHEAQADVVEEASLYSRLGGVYAIATVVDDFIDRVSVNDTLNANPAIDTARKHVPPAGLKFQVTAFMIEATGGPYKYHGRNMYDSHKPMHITDDEWNALAADFKVTLDKFEVPEREQQELFALVGTTKKDIVESTEGQ
jgi:hemoglobin